MKDSDVKDVMARISELATIEFKYKESKKSLSDAQANIHESIAWVKQFNLFTDDFQEIELGFGDINLDEAEENFLSLNRYESLSPSLLDELDDKDYIFPIKNTGRENGIYISKDQTCSIGDYRTIARNRTINKSRCYVRAALLPYVN